MIVHLYEECGDACVDRLRGMFGFALWDGRSEKLLLARDRIGIKPLYYAEVQGRLLFASELKSILQVAGVTRELNWQAAAHALTFLTTPLSETIFKGIRKLEPGCILTANPGRSPVVRRYWNLAFEPDYGRPERYFIERLRELIEESVALHMVSDVPLGAFLSGGVDSSAVTATAARLGTEPLKTFSIGFREAEYNEIHHARSVAQTFSTDHHELILGPDAMDDLERLAWHLDEPFGDSSAIPTYLVSKLASQSVKVVLSGDGGDELFGGYDKYLVEGRERRIPGFPASAGRVMRGIGRAMPEGMRGRNSLQHFSLSGPRRYLDASTLYRKADMLKLFRPECAEALRSSEPWREHESFLTSSRGHWLSNLQALDLRYYLPLDILTKVDRMSMAHSIETRVPLLDHKIVEFAATIPPEMNWRDGTTKWVLKQAMRGIVPESILNRPKRGFAVPLNYWFRNKMEPYLRDVLLGDRAQRRSMFDTRQIDRLLTKHRGGRNLDLQLWTLLSFELWARTFLDQPSGQRGSVAA